MSQSVEKDEHETAQIGSKMTDFSQFELFCVTYLERLIPLYVSQSEPVKPDLMGNYEHFFHALLPYLSQHDSQCQPSLRLTGHWNLRLIG